MARDKWYNEDTMPTPGTELFRSTRRFQLWAPDRLAPATAVPRDAGQPGHPDRPAVQAGAGDAAAHRVRRPGGAAGRAERPRVPVRAGIRDIRDFVVAYAFGWHEDNGRDYDPSGFDGSFAPHRRTERPKIAAPLDDLVAALQAGEKRSPEPDKYRYVHVIMLRLGSGGAGSIGAYLSRAEAEDAIEARRADDREAVARAAAPDASIEDRMVAGRADVELWIDTIPIQL